MSEKIIQKLKIGKVEVFLTKKNLNTDEGKDNLIFNLLRVIGIGGLILLTAQKWIINSLLILLPVITFLMYLAILTEFKYFSNNKKLSMRFW